MEIVKTVKETLGSIKDRVEVARRDARLDEIFSPKNAQLDNVREYRSESDKYRLIVTPFATKKGCWNYTRGVVFEGRRKIAEVRRNYSAFEYAFIEGHKNGHDYLVCGEDYQGQTVIELDTGKRVDFVPHAIDAGHGFCWVKVTPSPDGTILAVEGCIWACPYEVLIVDFRNPMEPPWAELHRESRYEEFLGWKDENTCSIGIEYEARKSDGKPENELTDEELEEMDRLEAESSYGDVWMTVKDKKVEWTRPSDMEVARDYILTCLKWRKKDDIPLHPDMRDMIQKHLANLETKERTQLIYEPEVKELLEWAVIDEVMDA